MTSDAIPAPAENEAPYHPTPRDMVLLEVPVEVKVSPGGLGTPSGRVAVRVRTANWRDNCSRVRLPRARSG